MSASRNRSATAWFVLTVTLIWTLPGSNLPALAQSTGAETTSGNAGLILQADEGERRVRRTGDFPFILKVDKQNGGSADFVMGMEDVKAGQAIPPHRHLHAAEIVFVHKGSALVTLGGREALVREGGTVYIPKNVRIALKNQTRVAARRLSPGTLCQSWYIGTGQGPDESDSQDEPRGD